MSIFKRTWKLLTEDPSKDISKPSMVDVKKQHPNAWTSWSKEDDRKLSKLFKEKKSIKELSEIFKRTEGAIESRIEKLNLKKETEKKEPSLTEKLYTLKHSTFNHSDVSIKDIEVGELFQDPVDRYHYRRSYVVGDKRSCIVKLQISGRTIFNRLVPDFPGLTERQIMGREGRPDFTSGILTHGEYNMKVQKINLTLKVDEDKRLPDGNITFYKSEIVNLSVVRETLKGKELSVRNLGNKRDRISNTNLNSVIFGYNDFIKNLIVSDFERELDLHKKKSELSKIVKAFNDNINEDVLSDLFSYSFDEINNHSIEKKNENNYSNWVLGINEHWEISLSIRDLRNEGVSFNMNEKLPNLFIEVGEAVNRLKSIHKDCNVELDMQSINSSKLIIKISPIYPNWLVSNERNKKQSEGRLNRVRGNNRFYEHQIRRGYQEGYQDYLYE